MARKLRCRRRVWDITLHITGEIVVGIWEGHLGSVQGLLKRWTVLSPLRGLFLFVFLFQSGKRFKSMIATQRFEKKMKNGAHFSTHSNNVAC